MRSALAGLVLLAWTASGQTLMAAKAVSECKGLEQTLCSGKERCSWVKAYKTSKGRDVTAFCRKKPERKKAVEAKPATGGLTQTAGQQAATRPSGPTP